MSTAVSAISQERRLLFSESTLGKDVLLIERCVVSEGVSQLFSCELDLLVDLAKNRSKLQQVTAENLIGKKFTAGVLQEKNERFFNGIITRFSEGHRDRRFAHFRAEVVPWAWLLTHRVNCRIFQGLTTPEIIKKIFADLRSDYSDLVHFRDASNGNFCKWDHCVQYRESDFNFISRLMEEEGIFYFFEHERGKHTLVFGNANSVFKACPGKSKIRFEPEAGYGEREDTITNFYKHQELHPGKYSTRDYHFELPDRNLEKTEATSIIPSVASNLEVFEYPGRYANRFNDPEKRISDVEPAGEDRARRRIEEHESHAVLFRGSSACRFLQPGHLFDVDRHPDLSGTYVLLSVNHIIIQTPRYVSGVETGAPYSNEFICVAKSVPVRPVRATQKPVIPGPQTAVVTVVSGDEHHGDKYGRIRVQFHWDRYGKKNESSTCWVRVAQPWAGGGWGAHFWPRVGQEVVVHFLEGDPDQPLIIGSVYNAANMPPYTLPDKYTVSGIQTRSSKSGNDKNYNELRFEDKMGSEQLFIHAEKDMDHSVENDSREQIGNNRHLVVANNQLEQVGNNKDTHVKGVRTEKVDGNVVITVGADHVEQIGGMMSHHVKGDRKDKVGGNASLTVAGDWKTKAQSFSLDAAMNHDQKVGMNYGLEAGMQMHLKAGMTLVIESGVQLSLKCGACFIDMNPAMMSISAPMVMINSGGSPGSGSGASPKAPDDPKDPSDPKDPDIADDGSKFTKL